MNADVWHGYTVPGRVQYGLTMAAGVVATTVMRSPATMLVEVMVPLPDVPLVVMVTVPLDTPFTFTVNVAVEVGPVTQAN